MGDDTKDSFVFFRSFYESIKNVPEENQLEIFQALCEYSLNNVISDNLSPISKALFILMKPNIDSSKKRYSASVENGKKGGRPRKNNNLEKPNDNLEKPNDNLEKPNDNLEKPNDNLEKPSENLNETQEKPTRNLNVDVDVDVDVNDNVNVNDNNNDNDKKTIKKKYGEYQRIVLSDNEYEKLCNDFGKEFIKNQISLLDEYVESNNNKNKYKNFNLVLRKSIRENWFKSNYQNKKDGWDYLNDEIKKIQGENDMPF